ncbi:MAG: xanthine dehydrogenase YagR molybdenum-binding subunit [Chitinophagaceae bacterium]|nr:xanthine dehydrogenase YagR molybdenum-binding subunit [Chitinophagaceae bacterium]
MGNHFFDKATMPAGQDRVDGRAKVTGTARFAAEHPVPELTYGVLVCSTITKGHIKSLDTKAAEKAAGVLAVLSHLNSPKVPGFDPPKPANKDEKPRAWDGLKVFYSDKIYFNGQPIAVVVADTYERALYAATLVKAEYIKEPHQTDFNANIKQAASPKGGGDDYTRGEANAWKKAPVTLEAEYIVPFEVHNPMELHAIIAVWEAEDKITVYDKTQGPKDTQQSIMQAFNLPEKNVQVVTEYVGGAFGSALRTWPHEIAAMLAAKKVNKPVKLVLGRDNMFTLVGYRPYTIQKIGLGATEDGKLTGITHTAISQTSSYEEFTEGAVGVSKFLYACPNVNTSYKLIPLDIGTPTWMRGPGEATGCFALESALDELSYKLNIDPVELRLRNYAETDPQRNLPWSSKYLKECYQMGAEKIGWFQRNRNPRSMQEDGMLVGYGMSTGVFGAFRWNATAKGIFHADGTLTVQSAVSDMGPGTSTSMVNIASEAFGLPHDKIKFELGSSSLPPGPTQGGSGTTSTLGSAVHEVCVELTNQLKQLALSAGNSPFKNAKPEGLAVENGNVLLVADRNIKMSYVDILKQHNKPELEFMKESNAGEEQKKYSMYSYSVHFTKLHVHPSTGVITIKKVVTAGDAGKIVSEKTARSQMIGGVTGGIGMALTEEGIIDHRYGRYVNNNLADYHVPVNADVPEIEALFVNRPDPYLNPMGAKGMGEIALIGYAASVANAVYHATGKRIRDLPITLDKIIS